MLYAVNSYESKAIKYFLLKNKTFQDENLDIWCLSKPIIDAFLWSGNYEFVCGELLASENKLLVKKSI